MSGITVQTETSWITNKMVGELLGTHAQRVRQLARDGHIRTLEIPGCHTRYALTDVMRLAESWSQTKESRTPA